MRRNIIFITLFYFLGGLYCFGQKEIILEKGIIQAELAKRVVQSFENTVGFYRQYTISGARKNIIKIWDISNGSLITTLVGHTDAITSFCFSPDGKYALSGSKDKTAKLWYLKTGKDIRTFQHLYTVELVCFSHDGKHIATSSNLYDIRHFKYIDAVMNYDCTLILWDTKTGDKIGDARGMNKNSSFSSMCFSPDGLHLLLGSSKNRVIAYVISSLIYSEKRMKPRTNHPHATFSNRNSDSFIEYKGVKCLVFKDDSIGGMRNVKSHNDSVISVCFSAKGNFILSGSKDKTIKLWDVESLELIHTFIDESSVTSVGFTDNDEYIISCNIDGLITIYGIISKSKIFTFSGGIRLSKNKDKADLWLFYKNTDSLNNDVKQRLLSKNILKKEKWQTTYDKAVSIKTETSIDTALILLKKEVSLLEDQSNIELDFSKSAERNKKIYNYTIDLSVMKKDYDSAVYYIEKKNFHSSKMLRGAVQITSADTTLKNALSYQNTSDSYIDSLYQLLTEEKSKLPHNRNNNTIDSLNDLYITYEQEYLLFIDSVINLYPELTNHFKKNINPEEFFRKKKNIPENMVIVEYLICDNKLITLIATKDKVIAKTKEIDANVLKENIKNFIHLCQVPNQKTRSINKLSKGLSKLFINPIEASLLGKEYIAFVPTDILLRFPFHCLKTRYSETRKEAYLIEVLKVFYINSFDLFLSSKEKTKHRIAAFGNPDKTLGFAEKEVNEIETIYKKKSKIFTQEQATEYAAKNIDNKEYNILHFATHGVLDFSNYNNSYLQLTKDSLTSNDGKLTLSEIRGSSNIRDYDLVVLSACNTAIPDEKIKGWINNPAILFFDKGVNSVIATLWAVDDEATGLMMNTFYSELKKTGSLFSNNSKMNKSIALQRAQISLIKNKEFNHPFYWAPFILMGDWR